MTHASSHTLVRPGANIRYWITGRLGAPLVVFSHGAVVDHRMWNPQLDFAARYRIVTYDIRGHGLSLASKAFCFSDAVDDLLALLDAVGAVDAVLVGQSMGGNLSQEIAYQHPERVRALVLAGCACNTWPLTRSERWLARLVIPLIGLYPRPLLVREVARRSSVVPAVRRYIRDSATAMRPQQIRAVLASLFSGLHPDPDYRTPMPELLIRGDQDRLGNFARVMPLWQQRDSDASYAVVKGAGHLVNSDNPVDFNALLDAFLNRVS
ncbi:alpha/beta fold hydrolase [Mycobacterium pseudokansasii]|uniref:3-oxoadipate enol-lactonase 2 n=1 Tax=Mycobacterium pseudokansasii TaxID=2341080 RepID=A0A498QQ14_9MYCO|nr:alpha/beta hydrolase [Mycobacterium pseudokansasii]VAZ91971.1 3-oxoadipate enol-lactonase 2 [Mycobacterium pseudokansasii]VAZ92922.1 3-oxoadipate enol-lactonase 2 [Mycobacterium pseudokansasii]VBA49068.1 3-oxoadipate enol-lactonase 2 [Mycobacterium pseudokansasii]